MWAERFSYVSLWLDNFLDQDCYLNNAYGFFRWLWVYRGSFAGKYPDELLRMQEVAVGQELDEWKRKIEEELRNIKAQ